ncbi:hypothetical protein [Neobacillus bataviensis]|uniref:hypothetical protein n=1 Tax=Neobacillus bataviensis TaxID=220685 RepID=UPI001CBC7173|nr:hypothetical protein [Neobacillus bataviensis]
MFLPVKSNIYKAFKKHEERIKVIFLKNDPQATNDISTQSNSNVIINDEYPHGMSVLKENDTSTSSGNLVSKLEEA